MPAAPGLNVMLPANVNGPDPEVETVIPGLAPVADMVPLPATVSAPVVARTLTAEAEPLLVVTVPLFVKVAPFTFIVMVLLPDRVTLLFTDVLALVVVVTAPPVILSTAAEAPLLANVRA